MKFKCNVMRPIFPLSQLMRLDQFLQRERSGSVVECLTQDRGFEALWRHCVVSLRKAHLSLLSTG